MASNPTVWVCGACGRVAEARRAFGDPSCMMNAVECWRSSVEFQPGGRLARYAVTAETDWVEPLAAPEPRAPKPPPTAAQVAARARRLAARAARRSGRPA